MAGSDATNAFSIFTAPCRTTTAARAPSGTRSSRDSAAPAATVLPAAAGPDARVPPGTPTAAPRIGAQRRLPAGRRPGAVLDRHHLRVRHPRLLDQVRPPLLGRRVAALLSDHRVLGRPGRLDPVVGLPAVGLLDHRDLDQPQ